MAPTVGRVRAPARSYALHTPCTACDALQRTRRSRLRPGRWKQASGSANHDHSQAWLGCYAGRRPRLPGGQHTRIRSISHIAVFSVGHRGAGPWECTRSDPSANGGREGALWGLISCSPCVEVAECRRCRSKNVEKLARRDRPGFASDVSRASLRAHRNKSGRLQWLGRLTAPDHCKSTRRG